MLCLRAPVSWHKQYSTQDSSNLNSCGLLLFTTSLDFIFYLSSSWTHEHTRQTARSCYQPALGAQSVPQFITLRSNNGKSQLTGLLPAYLLAVITFWLCPIPAGRSLLKQPCSRGRSDVRALRRTTTRTWRRTKAESRGRSSVCGWLWTWWAGHRTNEGRHEERHVSRRRHGRWWRWVGKQQVRSKVSWNAAVGAGLVSLSSFMSNMEVKPVCWKLVVLIIPMFPLWGIGSVSVLQSLPEMGQWKKKYRPKYTGCCGNCTVDKHL